MKKSTDNLELGQVAFKAINNWKSANKIKEIIVKLYSIFYYPDLDLAYSLDIAKEYKENRNLFEKKVKYFTKKYAGFRKFSTHDGGDWDFSCNENNLNSIGIKPIKNIINNKSYDGNKMISLGFEINGIVKAIISCKLNELMQDVIKRVLDKNGIQIKNDILVIYNTKNIKLDVPIGEYDFNNFSRIYIILNE